MGQSHRPADQEGAGVARLTTKDRPALQCDGCATELSTHWLTAAAEDGDPDQCTRGRQQAIACLRRRWHGTQPLMGEDETPGNLVVDRGDAVPVEPMGAMLPGLVRTPLWDTAPAPCGLTASGPTVDG